MTTTSPDTKDKLAESTKKLMNDPGLIFFGSMDAFMNLLCPPEEEADYDETD